MQPCNKRNKIRTKEHGEWKATKKETHEDSRKKSSSRIAVITRRFQDDF